MCTKENKNRREKEEEKTNCLHNWYDSLLPFIVWTLKEGANRAKVNKSAYLKSSYFEQQQQHRIQNAEHTNIQRYV